MRTNVILVILVTGGMLFLAGCDGSRSPEVTKSTNGDPPSASPAADVPQPTENELKSTTGDLPQDFTNSIGMKFKLIPAGEFMMGSPEGEEEWAKGEIDKENFDEDITATLKQMVDGETQHRVRITKPFYLSIYEVTVGDFRKFVEASGYKTEAEKDGVGGFGWDESAGELEGPDPKYTWRSPGWSQTGTHPVVNVSWNDAVAFCEWLSRSGKDLRYRLPTEAEWEYACRARTTTMYYHGDDPEGLAKVENVADGTMKEKFPGWSSAISTKDGYVFTAPVGRFEANRFGLYDMHGNVSEWCQDWKDNYPSSLEDDPVGPPDGSYRVLRGGSWPDSARCCRSAYRNGDTPRNRYYFLGFRLALVPADEPTDTEPQPSTDETKPVPEQPESKTDQQPSTGDVPKPTDTEPQPSAGEITPPIEQPIQEAEQQPPADDAAKPTGDASESPTGNTKQEFTNSIGMKFKLIPAGEFMMGSPEDEKDRYDNEQQYRVRITKPFYLGVYELTQEQYERVTGENPSRFKGSALPVERVSWNDAVEFCRKLSEKEGREYRLPTEAEWEYACRAGTTTPFNFGSVLNGEQANCNGNYPYGTTTKGPYKETTVPVGSYRANGFGLYDMHGNVWEWCQDWYDEDYYADSPVDDPVGPLAGSHRVLRGGSWNYVARRCRSAFRYRASPDFRDFGLGFRPALVPADESK